MSYELRVLSDLPKNYWPLNELTGNPVDMSGSGSNGTYVGTPLLALSAITAGGRSVLLDDADRFTATVPGFLNAGSEEVPVTLELWAKFPTIPTAARYLMGRDTAAAVVVLPSGLEFQALSSNGTRYAAHFKVHDWEQSFHIVANYVGRTLSLTVNGEAGEPVYFEGNFTTTTDTFTVGGNATTSATPVIISDAAVYSRALDYDTVLRHYYYGRAAMVPANIIQNAGGVYYPMDDAAAQVAFSYEDDLSAGTLSDTLQIVDGNIVAPLNTTGTHTSDIEYIGELSNIAGSRIDWSGLGVTVDISLDMGSTWTACTNHDEIPGLGPAANTTNKFFQLRKTLTGTATYEASLSKLSLVIYQTKSVSSNFSTLGLGVYGSPNLSPKASPPLESNSLMGATMKAGTYFTAPLSDPAASSLEMWVMRTQAATASEYIFAAAATTNAYLYVDATTAYSGGATFYINGQQKVPAIGDFPIGVWTHVLANLNSATTAPITLNANLSGTETGRFKIAHVALYPNTFDTVAAPLRYYMATGSASTTIAEPGAVLFSEDPTANKAYSFVWSSGQTGSR